MKLPKIFASMALDYKETPFLYVKVHLILGRIGYLFHNIIHPALDCLKATNPVGLGENSLGGQLAGQYANWSFDK